MFIQGAKNCAKDEQEYKEKQNIFNAYGDSHIQ